MMGANVGALSVSLGLDAAQYTEGLTKADVQAQQFAQQQTRTQASIDKTVASLAKQAQQIGLTTSQIKLQQLAAKGASDAQIASATASLQALDAAAAAAKAHASGLHDAEAATAGFSLASHAAQRELVVLAHELSQGNVKKFGSSLLVLAETTGAAGLLFSGMAVAVAAAAAIIGIFGLAAVKGAEESQALARAIDETGNVAGLTEGKFNDLAAAQAKQTNTTVGASRELLESLAASGRFSGQALTAAGTAASYFAKATGQSTDEVGKEFVGLADDVVAGADKMNRQYHFLDATQLQYIKTLHEQGDEQKAFIVTADALSERLKGVATNLGTLPAAWLSVKNAASSAWDAMLNIGRTETPEEKLAKISDQIKSAGDKSSPLFDAITGGDSGEPDVSALRQQQGLLQDDLKLGNQIAEAQARKVRQDEAEIAVAHLKESSLTKQEKLTRDLANANAIFDRAGRAQNDPERQQVLTDIRQKAYPSNPQKSTLDLDVARIKASAQAEEEVYKNADQVFSALRSAGLVDEQHYYAEKLFLLQANANAEEKALTDEIARRKIQKFTGEGAADKANENAKAITEAEAKLSKVRKDAATQETILGIESDAASRKRAAGYLAAELAEAQSLDATKRAHAQEIALVGVGGEARIQSQAHSQINDKYQSQIASANDDIAAKRAAAGGAATADDEEAYAKRIALLQTYQARALSEWDDYYAKLKTQESDASLGYQKGLADYETSIGSLSDRVSKATGDTFKSLEDALVTFATTGKLSVKGLIDTVVAGIERIAVQEGLTKPLASFLQGTTGPGSSGGGFGGLVSSFLGLFGAGKSSAGTGTAMGSAAGVLGAVDSQAASAAAAAAAETAAAETALATSSTAAATATAAASATTETSLVSLAAAAESAATALATVAASSGASSAAGAGASAGGLAGLFGGAAGSTAMGSSAGVLGAVDSQAANVSGGLATGGRALPGKLYPVTERGPEVLDVNGKQYLMTGGGRANVKPLSDGGQSGAQRPITIIQNFTAGTTKVTTDQAAARAGQVVRKASIRG